MSKSKRSLEEEILHYRKKIQKLEEQIPGTSGTTVTFAGEYREREPTAPSEEIPDRRDSRNVSPAIHLRPHDGISPVPETRPLREIPATESTRRDIPVTESTRRDIPITPIPRNISSTQWKPPRDISPIREAIKTPAIIESRRRDSLLSAIDPRQLRDIPAAESRKPCDISPVTQVRDPPPAALGTPNSPPSEARDSDEPRVLPQQNLNLTESNTLDSHISTSTPVRQRATGKKTRKTSEIGLEKNSYEMDRKEALLNALGDDLSLCGENIDASLEQEWTNILRKGLPMDMKDRLLKKYAAPDNCRLLKAPTLNNEIYTIAEFNSRNRDQILEDKQNQLGLGISAIGKAITELLTNNQEKSYESYEVNAMRHFNHGCRLLLDLHYTETSSRRHLFKTELCRSDVFRNLKIQDLERDDTLFGNKVSKMVKKQGIPPTPAHQRPSSSSYGDLPLAPHHIRNGSPRYRRN